MSNEQLEMKIVVIHYIQLLTPHCSFIYFIPICFFISAKYFLVSGSMFDTILLASSSMRI